MKLEELEGNVVTALEDYELVAFARLELASSSSFTHAPGLSEARDFENSASDFLVSSGWYGGGDEI